MFYLNLEVRFSGKTLKEGEVFPAGVKDTKELKLKKS
jgi:hypothetical protein